MNIKIVDTGCVTAAELELQLNTLSNEGFQVTRALERTSWAPCWLMLEQRGPKHMKIVPAAAAPTADAQ